MSPDLSIPDIYGGLYVLVAAIFVLFVAVWGIRRSVSPQYPYKRQASLLTPSEMAFYNVLKTACPADLQIMVKVRLGDIITCAPHLWHKGYGPRISAKHIDFVLTHPQNMVPVLAIELDDSSHKRPDRVARDKFVDNAMVAANMPLLRIPNRRRYNVHELAKRIRSYLKEE